MKPVLFRMQIARALPGRLAQDSVLLRPRKRPHWLSRATGRVGVPRTDPDSLPPRTPDSLRLHMARRPGLRAGDQGGPRAPTLRTPDCGGKWHF